MRILLCMLCLLVPATNVRAANLTEILAYNGAIRDETKRLEKWYEQGLKMRPIRFMLTHEGGVRTCSITRSATYLVDRPGQEQKQMVRATYQVFDRGCSGKATSAKVMFRGPGAVEVRQLILRNTQYIYDNHVGYVTDLERQEHIDRIVGKNITRW